MGFFQDLKEDLSQAVTELMDEDADKGQPVVTENIEESNMEEETIEQDMEVAEMSFIENLPEQAEDEEKTLKDVQSETEHNLEAEIADFLKAQETEVDTTKDVRDSKVFAFKIGIAQAFGKAERGQKTHETHGQR